MLKLTKKSKDELYNSPIGNGILLVNTGKNEFERIEFYQGRNGNFYLVNNCIPSTLLEHHLKDLAKELKGRIKDESI